MSVFGLVQAMMSDVKKALADIDEQIFWDSIDQ